MPRKIALLIGVSEYGEGIPSLSAPRNDVMAIKRVLENPQMGGFDAVKTLPDPDLTAMQRAVQQVFANCRKDDLVLLFFSGHGITDDNNRLYLATKGTSKDLYKSTSVPASFIQDVSIESYAKRQAIILDCCYSGAFAEGWQTKSIGLDLKQELGAEGRVVLTSSSATQKSFQQEEGELSLYTKYFIEGIETGAAGIKEQGKIYAYELHDYAKTKVQEVKPKQKPEIIIDQEGFNIILSQSPVNDPELNFRKLVEKYATDGQITVTGNYILGLQRQKLDITEEKSQKIINEVLAPYRQRLENITLYQQALTEAVAHHYPLTKRLLSELQDLQDILGLEDQDITSVKEEVIAEKETGSQQIADAKNLPENPIPSKELFNRALDKQNKGDNQGAIADYTDAIQTNQNWGDQSGTYYGLPTAYNNRGIAHRNLGEYEKAIADYNQAINLKPDYADAYNNRGVAHRNLGEYEKAIADYNQAINLKPDYANAYYNRGNTHDDLKEYEKAIADYNQAINLKPDDASAYNNRGIAHYNLGEYEKAIADYNQAINLKPDYANAYYNRGNAHYYLKEYEKAIADYTQGINLKPDDAFAYYIRGNAHKNLEKYEKAIADYNQAINLKPDYANAYYNRGIAHKNRGDNQAAIKDYQKAAEIYQNQQKTDDYHDAINQVRKLQQ